MYIHQDTVEINPLDINCCTLLIQSDTPLISSPSNCSLQDGNSNKMATEMSTTRSNKRKNRISSPIPIASDENGQQIESTTLSHLSQTDNINYEYKTQRTQPPLFNHLSSPINTINGFSFNHAPKNQFHAYHHHLSYAQHPLAAPLGLSSSLSHQSSQTTLIDIPSVRFNNNNGTSSQPPSMETMENSADLTFYNNLIPTTDESSSIITSNNDYRHKIHCLEYHRDTVLCVAKCQFVNHNQKLVEYIFSGSQDSSIGVWSTDTFQLQGTLLGHCRSILNLYVINDTIINPLLLSTSRDNCICIWDIKTLSLLFRITGLPSLVYDVEVLSFTRNGGYYLYGCCQDTNIFSLSLSILPYLMKLQYEKLKIEHQHKKQMEAFRKKSKSKLQAKSSSKSQVHENTHSSTTPSSSVGIASNLSVLEDCLLLNKPTILSPAGFKQEWIDNDDETESQEIKDKTSELVKICDESSFNTLEPKPGCVTPSKIISAKMNFELPTETNEIREIITTDATVQFLSKSVDDIIDIYYDLLCDEDDDENNSESQHTIHQIFAGCHHGFIFRMSKLENEYKLITAASDATIKIWDVLNERGTQQLKLLSVLTGHSHSVIDLDLIGNEYLITASRDETLKVWNIKNINKPHTRYTMNGHDVELTAIKVIHNGSLIVSASRDGTVKFWDGKSFQCLKTYKINQQQSIINNVRGESMANLTVSATNSMSLLTPSPKLYKSWTCDADKLEQDKPICVMRFEFMEPSWLLLCDTAYRVEIWDISYLLKQHGYGDKNNSMNGNRRTSIYNSSPVKENFDEEKYELFDDDIESILNGLDLSEYIDNFKKEKVDYDVLFYLSDTDLIQLNVPLGPRKKIVKYIEQRKANKVNSISNDKKLNTMMLPMRSDPNSVLFGGVSSNGHESYNMIADLAKFISYKSISCKKEYQSQCWNAAYFIQTKCEQFGAETRLAQGNVGKNPVVLSRFTNNLNINCDNIIRIVMYGHYDVVDINNECGWDNDPFKLTGKNGYLYGRGTTDNKGPIIVFLYAIRELLEEINNDLSVEIIMILEGQEEHDWNNGGLKEVVEKNMDWLENPVVIICSNSYWIGEQVPCLVYGMRGHLQLKVTIMGSKQDCHSGVHGGVFSEPMFDLIQILSKLKHPTTNKILIPSFYDNILPLKQDETKLYDEIIGTFNVDSYLESIGFDTKNKINNNDNNDINDNGKALLMQKWRNPSLSIHNIQQSSNACTVISKYASAVISIRTVPNQKNINIIDCVQKYLLNEFKLLSTYNNINITYNNIGDHWLMDYNNYIFKCAEKSIIKHWGIKPYYIREGGTIPCTNYLYNKLNCPILQFPLGQSTDRAHLENERIRLQNLSTGKDVIKSFLLNLIQHHQQKQHK